jgi:hypothetical protein
MVKVSPSLRLLSVIAVTIFRYSFNALILQLNNCLAGG